MSKHEYLPPVLEELLVDPQGKIAQKRIRELIAELEGNDLPPRAIARGIGHVLKWYCLEQYEKWGDDRLWALRFMRTCGETLKTEERALGRAERLVTAYDKLLKREPAGEA